VGFINIISSFAAKNYYFGMNRIYFRIALPVLLSLVAVHRANATPLNQKNIYLAVEAYPSVAGVVYADVKPADTKYAKDKTGWGPVSSMKATLQQNGSDANELGMYEAVVSAKANGDYEFVCYSYECYSNDWPIYLKPDIMLEASGFDSETRTFTEATNAMGVNGTGAILNVYTGNRNDPNSDAIKREDLFASDNWSESPDLTVYAIFRRKGDIYPTIDQELGVEDVACEPQRLNGKAYSLQGTPVDDAYKGIVIINGKKVLRKL